MTPSCGGFKNLEILRAVGAGVPAATMEEREVGLAHCRRPRVSFNAHELTSMPATRQSSKELVSASFPVGRLCRTIFREELGGARLAQPSPFPTPFSKPQHW